MFGLLSDVAVIINACLMLSCYFHCSYLMVMLSFFNFNLIWLLFLQSRNDARSRIAPARVHLNNVSNIVSQLQVLY